MSIKPIKNWNELVDSIKYFQDGHSHDSSGRSVSDLKELYHLQMIYFGFIQQHYYNGYFDKVPFSPITDDLIQKVRAFHDPIELPGFMKYTSHNKYDPEYVTTRSGDNFTTVRMGNQAHDMLICSVASCLKGRSMNITTASSIAFEAVQHYAQIPIVHFFSSLYYLNDHLPGKGRKSYLDQLSNPQDQLRPSQYRCIDGLLFHIYDGLNEGEIITDELVCKKILAYFSEQATSTNTSQNESRSEAKITDQNKSIMGLKPDIEKMEAENNSKRLLQTLKLDEDPDIRHKALEALGRIGWKPKNDEEKALYDQVMSGKSVAEPAIKPSLIQGNNLEKSEAKCGYEYHPNKSAFTEMDLTFYEKVKGFLMGPSKTFDVLKKNTLGDALKYYFIISAIFSALVAILFEIAPDLYLSSMGLRELGIDYGDGVLVGLFYFIFGIIGIFITGAIYQIGFYIVGGKKDIQKTIKVLAYAGTPTLLLGWIPIISNIGGLWAFCLTFIGLRQYHELTTRKTILVMFTPLIIIGILIVVAIEVLL